MVVPLSDCTKLWKIQDSDMTSVVASVGHTHTHTQFRVEDAPTFTLGFRCQGLVETMAISRTCPRRTTCLVPNFEAKGCVLLGTVQPTRYFLKYRKPPGLSEH